MATLSAVFRTQLCHSAGAGRLVVVHLARDNTFASLTQVQDELAGTVLELAPDNLPARYTRVFRYSHINLLYPGIRFPS